MTRTGMEDVLRDALTRAQDAAPTPADLFPGIVCRRRQHRRNVALAAVAGVAALAAIAVPVTAAVSALRPPTRIDPTHDLHRTATPIGAMTDRWLLDTTSAATIVTGGHAYQVTTDAHPELIQIGDDGTHRHSLPASLASPGDPVEVAANTHAVFLTFPNASPSPVWRVDLKSFKVTTRTSLPTQALRLTASDEGVYVMGGDDTLYQLDTTTLAVKNSYRVFSYKPTGPTNDDYSMGDMISDRDGIDIIAVKSQGRQPWLQHFSSTLQPVGRRIPLTTADQNLIGSPCGVLAIQERHQANGTRSTVTFNWQDPQSPSLTVQGNVDGVARECSSKTAYLLTNSGDSADVIRILRVDLRAAGKPVVTATWTPDPMLPFTGISRDGPDLWLIGPTIARVRVGAGQ